MIDENVKTLIGWWKLKGENENDPFVRFFFFYVCFDAWITALSGEDVDYKKLNWFSNNESPLKKYWPDIQSSVTKSWLSELKNLSPVEDMRPNHLGEKTYLKDIEDLNQIVRFIYQIRCNLFHGSKDPMNKRDTSLVELSGMILQKWVIWTYHKC